jgi:hypothetical protein
MFDVTYEFYNVKMTDQIMKSVSKIIQAGGELIKRTAKASIKTVPRGPITKTRHWGGGESKPGTPHHTRKGKSRNKIKRAKGIRKYEVAQFIGPTKTKLNIGHLMEFGGLGTRSSDDSKRRHYPKRPVMVPALNRAFPKILSEFKNIL